MKPRGAGSVRPSRQQTWLRWLALGAVVSMFLAMGIVLGRISLRAAARQQVEQFGGRIVTSQGGPAWVRRWLAGNRLFTGERDTVVNLMAAPIQDADLVWLRWLRGVERLNREITAISNDGLPWIRRLSRLKALDLSGTQMTGAGLDQLKGLKNLEFLYLRGIAVVPSDLTALEGMRKLRTLDLTETGCPAAAIEALRSARPGLQILSDPPACLQTPPNAGRVVTNFLIPYGARAPRESLLPRDNRNHDCF